jgi:hypothetical protein
MRGKHICDFMLASRETKEADMRRPASLLAASILTLVVMQTESFAQAAVGYVATGTTCESAFVRSKSGLQFAPKVDAFAPAFIIKGKTLSTPLARCRLTRSAMKGDMREVSFECASSISYAPVTLYFRRGENGSLIRQASATERDGNLYEVCKP